MPITVHTGTDPTSANSKGGRGPTPAPTETFGVPSQQNVGVPSQRTVDDEAVDDKTCCWCVDLTPPADKSREDSAGIISGLFVFWVEAVLHISARRKLQLYDFGVLNEIDTAHHQSELIGKAFQKRTEKNGGEPPKSLWVVIMDVVDWFQAFVAVGAGLLQAVTSILGVMILNNVVKHFEGCPPRKPDCGHVMSNTMLWLHAFGAIGLPIIGGLCGAHRMQLSCRLGGRIRAGIMSLIYRKSLRLHSLTDEADQQGTDNKGKGGGSSCFTRGDTKDAGKGGKDGKGGKGSGGGAGTAMGKVTMLMSVDAQKFVDGVQNIAALCVFPFQITFIFSYLFVVAGPIPARHIPSPSPRPQSSHSSDHIVTLTLTLALALSIGLGYIFFICFPLIRHFQQINRQYNEQFLACSDRRISLVNEAMGGIRVVRQYAWEDAVLAKVQQARGRELYYMKWFIYVQSCGLQLILQSTPMLAPCFTLVLYAETSDEPLTAATAFTVILLFMTLRMPFQQFQMTLNQVVMLQVAVDRMTKFLTRSELPHDIVDRSHTSGKVSLSSCSFSFKEPESREVRLGSPGKSVPVQSVTGLNIRKQMGNASVMKDVDAMGYETTTGLNIRNTLAAANIIPERKDLLDGQFDLPCSGADIAAAREMHAADSTQQSPTGSSSGMQQLDIEMDATRDAPANSTSGVGSANGSSLQVEVVLTSEAIESTLPPQSPTEAGLKVDKVMLQPGQFMAVVGGVGSGKSSFLSALLGDMIKVNEDGHIQVGGTISYACQEPFILNATIRENITFGAEYEKAKFDAVIKACAMESDLRILNGGEFCMIGERGITLSGGQKARVALARAIYADTDIVLLDDPLAAVDSHVGRHIFDNCINGHLKGRTRILVTNQIQYLTPGSAHPGGACDQILLMERCQQSALGTFHELVAESPTFAAMVSACNANKEKDLPSPESHTNKGRGEIKGDIKENKEEGQGKTEEMREEGSVGFSNYITYMRSGGWCWCFFTLIAFFITDGLRIFAEFTVSAWTKNATKGMTTEAWVYLGFIASSLIGLIIRSMLMAQVNINASSTIHERLLRSVLRAQACFFDVTPMGRVMNRFSSDMHRVDQEIRMFLFQACATGCQLVVAVLTMIIATKGAAALAIVPMIACYKMVNDFYRIGNTDITRLESTTRSPIFALFSESLHGMHTIRAYDAVDRFVHIAEKTMDENLLTVVVQRTARAWLAMRLEMMGSLLSGGIIILGITTTGILEPELIGLALAYALELTSFLKMFTVMSSELEAKMVSVERVQEYIDFLPQESPPVIESNRPPINWPSQGAIEFTGAKMRYREGLPLVLQGLDLRIEPGRRVGIVGRTGAGKSSLLVSLFRMAELWEGSLTMCGRGQNRGAGPAKGVDHHPAGPVRAEWEPAIQPGPISRGGG